MRNSSQFTTQSVVKTWKRRINCLTTLPLSIERPLGYHLSSTLKFSWNKCKPSRSSSTRSRPQSKPMKAIISTSLSNLTSSCSKTSSTWTWNGRGTSTLWRCSQFALSCEIKKELKAQAQRSKWNWSLCGPFLTRSGSWWMTFARRKILILTRSANSNWPPYASLSYPIAKVIELGQFWSSSEIRK